MRQRTKTVVVAALAVAIVGAVVFVIAGMPRLRPEWVPRLRPEWVGAIGQPIGAVIAGLTLWMAIRIQGRLKEIEESRWENERERQCSAYVTARLDSKNHSTYLTLMNIGQATATDVDVKIDPLDSDTLPKWAANRLDREGLPLAALDRGGSWSMRTGTTIPGTAKAVEVEITWNDEREGQQSNTLPLSRIHPTSKGTLSDLHRNASIGP